MTCTVSPSNACEAAEARQDGQAQLLGHGPPFSGKCRGQKRQAAQRRLRFRYGFLFVTDNDTSKSSKL